MTYLILTERSKTDHPNLSGACWYSRVWGCFSKRDRASRFDSFEAAQPTVRSLRNAGLTFCYAVQVMP